MDPANTAERPIVVRWLWDECHLLGGRRAFVVEIPAERAVGLLAAEFADEVAAFMEATHTFAFMWPGTVTEGHVTCIVSNDGDVVGSCQGPWFPYSNMWNGNSPLLRLGIRIDELEDLKNISDERIRIAIADGIRSVWCLDPDSWNGTELEVSRGE